MIILNYRPGDDQFWIGCTFEEAEGKILPLMERENILRYNDLKREYRELIKGEHFVQGIRDCYGINDIPEAFINISRDLEICYPEIPLFPFAGQWNGYSPFMDCDHVEFQDPSELRRMVATYNGEPFPNQALPPKRRLYLDMDGTLVDFQSGVARVNPEILAQYKDDPDDIEGIFALMDPMPGAVKAVYKLAEYYDCYILSTAPWDNPSAWSDKISWVKKHFGDVLYKKVILTHHKELLNDGTSILVDDRKKHGSESFGKNLIVFDSKNQTWEMITSRLIEML